MSEIKPKDRKGLKVVALMLGALLVLSTGYYIYTSQPKNPKLATKETVQMAIGAMVHNDVHLALNVTVTDKQGHLVANRYEPNDLILNNFYNWMIGFLDNAQTGVEITSSLKNTAGSAVTAGMWGSISSACGGGFGCTGAGEGGLIEVGTLSTAATRADFTIGAAYQSFFGTTSACSQGGTDTILVAGSENANTGTTITESGLFYQFSGSVQAIMLAHDVFAGIVVSGGNTITVQYSWSLNNGGFNYNLCEFLAAYFTQPNGAGGNVKTPNSLMVFFDTNGKNVTWVPNCVPAGAVWGGALFPVLSSAPTTSQCQPWASGDTNNAMKIAIGTGSAAFTPTSRSLTALYASNFITNATYDSAGNAYETATVLLTTGATISEAAIYLTLPKGCIGYSPLKSAGAGSCTQGYASDTIMLLAATFSGQVVPNNQAIGITFQEAG